MDIGFLYNHVINLFIRFFNWSFTAWGVTIHVYSIFIFTLLVVLFVKFVNFLRGV